MKKNNTNNNSAKNDKTSNRKKGILLVLAILGVVLVIILGLVLLFKNDDKKNLNNEEGGPTEEVIEENYSFTKDDAINLIKPLFHSDNYSFEAELNDDSLYVVTITNTLTSTKYIYYVDPATQTYKIDDNTK